MRKADALRITSAVSRCPRSMIPLPFVSGVGDNDYMSAIETKPDIDLQELADHEAAERSFIESKPLPPDLARRIQERANRASAEVRRNYGLSDSECLNQLVRDVRDEA